MGMTTKYRILKRTKPACGSCPALTAYLIQHQWLGIWWTTGAGYYAPPLYETLEEARKQLDSLICDSMPTIDVVVDE